MMITDPRMTCTPCIYIIPKRSEKAHENQQRLKGKNPADERYFRFSFSLSIGAPLRSQVQV